MFGAEYLTLNFLLLLYCLKYFHGCFLNYIVQILRYKETDWSSVNCFATINVSIRNEYYFHNSYIFQISHNEVVVNAKLLIMNASFQNKHIYVYIPSLHKHKNLGLKKIYMWSWYLQVCYKPLFWLILSDWFFEHIGTWAVLLKAQTPAVNDKRLKLWFIWATFTCTVNWDYTVSECYRKQHY